MIPHSGATIYCYFLVYEDDIINTHRFVLVTPLINSCTPVQKIHFRSENCTVSKGIFKIIDKILEIEAMAILGIPFRVTFYQFMYSC